MYEAPKSTRPVILWLLVGCAMIACMVAIGGITRLTESGLSITEWKPVTGALPPLSEAAWQAEFEKYKQIPEYQLLNQGMDLAGFKRIFFWEYLHRLWGRLLGLAFGVQHVDVKGQLLGAGVPLHAVDQHALFIVGVGDQRKKLHQDQGTAGQHRQPVAVPPSTTSKRCNGAH